ncbi:hypothetical protein [Vallitalea guaymasensis]|uniref:Uncharacterized protein n=1 Tax=Vallitalea guaymasensis TaxID=1185412 RepID=A0A8J8SC62_9FIRM|nr:hypothetical protein [Vallitalea guaymasensis]QUH29110.1 hypothetical protein HYG85_09315 [Vallitalea guaymasensis]
MKVVVYSPVRRQGCTTLSVLLGSAIAQVTNMKVCLTYTGTESDAFNIALGLNQVEDRTKSLTQVIRMLEANSITGKDINDYLTPLTDNLDIMQTSSDYITTEESDKLLTFVLNNLTHDLIITEINSEPYEESTKEILSNADIIIVLASQGMDVINKYKNWKDSDIFPDYSKVVYALNYYDPNVSALRDVAKIMGIKPSKIVKITTNPFIKKMTNTGSLHKLLPYIYNKDIRVINLHADIRDLCYLVMSNLGIKIDWGKNK